MDRSENNEYMRQYMLRRYYLRKEKAIRQLGGRCLDCGTTEDLQFHHIDPDKKLFTIGSILNGVSETKLNEELEKCALLCKPCHKERHMRTELCHGMAWAYQSGCRCEACTNAQTEAIRAYRKKRQKLCPVCGVTIDFRSSTCRACRYKK